MRTGIIAGEIAGAKPRDRSVNAPGQSGFLCDAEVDAYLANGGDVAIFRHARNTQHAAQIGYRTHDEADAGAAAAFQNANLYPLLRGGRGNGCNQHGRGCNGEDDCAAHEAISS